MARLKKKTVKRSGSKKKKLYFGKEAHDAIIAYQSTECRKEKERIYEKQIRQSFHKLVENLIFIHGFARDPFTFQTLKFDCVTFLYETLHKFDASRGTKAFSYFNVVAKNWLIIQSKKKTKITKRQVSLEEILTLSEEDINSVQTYNVVPPQDQKIIKDDRKNHSSN